MYPRRPGACGAAAAVPAAYAGPTPIIAAKRYSDRARVQGVHTDAQAAGPPTHFSASRQRSSFFPSSSFRSRRRLRGRISLGSRADSNGHTVARCTPLFSSYDAAPIPSRRANRGDTVPSTASSSCSDVRAADATRARTPRRGRRLTLSAAARICSSPATGMPRHRPPAKRKPDIGPRPGPQRHSLLVAGAE